MGTTSNPLLQHKFHRGEVFHEEHLEHPWSELPSSTVAAHFVMAASTTAIEAIARQLRIGDTNN